MPSGRCSEDVLPAAVAVRSVVVALLLVAIGGCVDPNFTANGEDARRLELLKSDAMYSYLNGRAKCEEALARYLPRNGLPLDFARIEPNRVECDLPNRETAELLIAAEAAAWVPSVSYIGFRFQKKLGKLWASMEVATGGLADPTIILAIPEHGREEDAPRPAEIAAGRACLDAVRAKAPPTPDCSLAP